MARPLEDGVKYFPLDTGFYRDKKVKLLRQRYGAKAVYILTVLWADIYESAGYFKKWDEDDCLLMADAISCGCSPELIGQVIDECVRRGLFDEAVFSGFGVLTSAGVQRRYMRMLNNRDEIVIIKEYWLLDVNDKKDVPSSTSKKITFKSLGSNFKADKINFNPDKSTFNEQSKVNKTKVKQTKQD